MLDLAVAAKYPLSGIAALDHVGDDLKGHCRLIYKRLGGNSCRLVRPENKTTVQGNGNDPALTGQPEAPVVRETIAAETWDEGTARPVCASMECEDEITATGNRL